MTELTIDEAKAALRTTAHKQRASFLASHRLDAAAAVADAFFAGVHVGPAEVVAAYWPIRDELDCRQIVSRLMASGHRVCLPVVVGPDETLQFRQWDEGAPLVAAGFGALAPAADAPLVEPDIVLLPLLGFDAAGTRLGYGGGYYDRTIAALPRRPRLIGFGFAAQELEHIPRGPHDLPLDAVLTERGLRHFSSEAVLQ